MAATKKAAVKKPAAKKMVAKTAAAKKSAPTPAIETVCAFKAFDKDLKCSGFQYEIGKTYEHKGQVLACSSGFHACENPLDTLSYYSLFDSRFAVVELGGKMSREGRDTKVAAASITITAEIKLPEFIAAGVNYLTGWLKGALEEADTASGNASQLAASGYASKLAASGYASKLAASGNASQLAASGYASKLAASGNDSQLAASGYASQLAASGNDSQLAASGYASQLAASGNDSQLAASGYASQLAASGYASKLAASGNASQLAASGNDSVIAAAGFGCKAKAGKQGAIALSYFDGGRARFCVGYVGEDGIKPDTWYAVQGGQLVEVAE